jgi:hypothetical protein
MKKLTMAIMILFAASFIWGANLISEGFTTTSLPTGWSGDVYFNSTANHGTLTGANGAGFNANLKYLQTPSVNTAGTLTFWTKGSSATSQISYRVLKSVGGGAFSTIADYPKPHNDTWTLRTVTVNDASSNIVIKIEAYDRTGNSIYLDDVVLTDYSAGTPTITVTGTLTGFSTPAGTASAYQSYKVSGANLTADISVTAPANFELCKTAGGTYTSGLTYAQSGGAVAEQDVFIRIAASATAGTYTNVNITHTSTGATQVNKAVSGTVYKAEPTNHVGSFAVATGTPSYSVIGALWTDATGAVIPDGYLVKGSSTSFAAILDPVDGTPEADGALVKNVAAGIQTASFTGLSENTTYYFKIYPYTNSGANINYKTDGTVPTDSEPTSFGPPAVPTATAASAISQEGFTAHWNAVAGATSYRLDVLEGSPAVATDLFISEYLEGSGNNKYIEVFNGTGSSVDLSDYKLQLYANGATSPTSDITLSGSLANGACVVYKNSLSTLTLPVGVTAIANAAVNFNGDDAVALYKISTSAFVDIFGWIGSPDPGTEWGSSPLWTINTTLVRKNTVTGGVTTNPVSGTFETLTTEWDYYVTDTATYLGSHTMGSALTPVSGYNNLSVSDTIKRVAGLSASTDYSYRVRSFNSSGVSSSSNLIDVTTTASIPGVCASTAVGGASTVVYIPPLPTYTDNSVEIDPDTVTNDDFTVTVAEIANGLSYTINTSNNLALNGVYWINHAGFGEIPILSASIGSMAVNASDATASLVTISGINAKGDLVINVEHEPTLPVELSSFTATTNAQNYVNLMWITQSETGVNGFYIHRGSTSDLSQALVVSPMISATNTSSQQSYMFTDSEVSESGTYYYWLQIQDLDGGIAYHGPTTIYYETGSNPGTPNIPLVTALNGIYPNPFNPNATLSYGLAKQGEVNFVIYNARGQIVRTFSEGLKAAGNYKTYWNGMDNNGRSCSTGVYYVKMLAGNDTYIRKAVLMK